MFRCRMKFKVVKHFHWHGSAGEVMLSDVSRIRHDVGMLIRVATEEVDGLTELSNEAHREWKMPF